MLRQAKHLRTVILGTESSRRSVMLSAAGLRAQRRISRTTGRGREILRRLRLAWRPDAIRPAPALGGYSGVGADNLAATLSMRPLNASLAFETPPLVQASTTEYASVPHEGPGYDLALVLSGGGARGFAHVGVLQVIDELRLPVDLVVGVSMGSIVGAAYAAGLSPDQMADLARAMRLSRIFRPRPGRLNLIDPAGIQAVIARIFGTLRFADLERELVVVSSSITTGEHVVIRDGPIVDAIVASCAIPLIFPPVSRDGHQLLDGGLIDGLPIAVARGLGARRIVAVDASTHARHVLRLPGVSHATRGVVRILDRRHRRRPAAGLDAARIFSRVLHHATLSPARPPVELLIRPAFGRRSTLHYHRWPDMVACGRAAADAARPALASFGDPTALFAPVSG